ASWLIWSSPYPRPNSGLERTGAALADAPQDQAPDTLPRHNRQLVRVLGTFVFLDRVAAVDHDRLTGDVRRLRRGEERDGCGDLVRRAGAADRSVESGAALSIGRRGRRDPSRL